MHIEFTRTGGFAGIRLATTVDTKDLPPDQASTLDRLVAEATFFKLPDQLKPDAPSPARDRFEYKITIADPEHTHSVDVSDDAVPESLRPLINYLTTLAMVSRKS